MKTRMGQVWAGFLMAVAVPAFANDPWALEDLSILFPIPKTMAERYNCISPGLTAGHGKVFDSKWLKYLPPTFNSMIYEELCVVGVRLDPTFSETHPTPTGAPNIDGAQIRLVLQDLRGSPFRPLIADGGYHLFFSVPLDELKELATKIRDLRNHRPAPLTLGVHSILEAEGANSAYGQQLKEHILKSIGHDRLKRITFNSSNLVEGGANATQLTWMLGGFNVTDTKLFRFESIKIPNVTEHYSMAARGPHPVTMLAVQGEPSPTSEFKTQVFPPLGTDPQFNSLDNAVFNLPKKLELKAPIPSHNELQVMANQVNRINNPTLTNTGNTDCMSCHRTWETERTLRRADTTLDWSRDRLPLNFQTYDQGYPQVGYQGVVTVQFGYGLNSPLVSPRVMNETIQVQNWFSQNLP